MAWIRHTAHDAKETVQDAQVEIVAGGIALVATVATVVSLSWLGM